MTSMPATSDVAHAALHVRVGQYSEAGVKADNQDALAMRLPFGEPLRTKGLVAALADGLGTGIGPRLGDKVGARRPGQRRTGQQAAQTAQALAEVVGEQRHDR
mgnify:CR=1 FL=1